MAPNSIPHLCGGTFFDLILESCKPHTKARNRQNGVSDGITNPAVYAGILTVITGEEPLINGGTLEKVASSYKKCEYISDSEYRWDDKYTISRFHTAVTKKDPAVLNRMTEFIDKYLSKDKCEWLVCALIETIQKDSGIDRHQEIDINATETASVERLHEVSKVELAPFLISVLDHVLQYSPDAESGRPTFESWYFQSSKKAEWKFREDITIGESISPIEVIMPSDKYSYESTEVLPDHNPTSSPSSADQQSDDEVITGSLSASLAVFENALEVQKHQMAETIRENRRHHDDEVLDSFKNDSDSVLQYCIEKDLADEPIDPTLPDRIDSIIRKWNSELRKINDPEKRGLVAKAIETLTEYSRYLSDTYLRINENNGMLIFRNNTIEEGDRLRNDLRPNSILLRKELKSLYQKLWPSPELDNHHCENGADTTMDQSQNPDNEKNAKVMQQTVVNQYGSHAININHVENLKLGGDDDN